MDNTVICLCRLIERLASETNRSTSTISRLATGSGTTFERLKAVDAQGKPKHRITTERASRAIRRLSDLWPAYLEWPSDISRPKVASRRAA